MLVIHHNTDNLSAAALLGVVLLLDLLCVACGSRQESMKIQPVYDKTGKLQLLKYDANGDGKVDTWTYMDGSRIVRIEIDSDQDGKIDRWEHYGPSQQLEKIGFSRANDGIEDAWSFPGQDGAIARIEISGHRDGKVTRTEYYEKGMLVRAEEDTQGDGAVDKWEVYNGGLLASVAFDTSHRGRADRRLVYGPNGSARAEIDPEGNGHFVPAPETGVPAPPDRRK
jgi:hypothetical protein